jgi:hypothetical protein
VAKFARQVRKRREFAAFEAALAELEVDGRHVSPALLVACPECGAIVGRRCRTRTGRGRPDAHRARDTALERARGREGADQLRAAHYAWLEQSGVPGIGVRLT